MINASPNLNGNSTKDFTDAASELTDALNLVEEALGKIRSNVLHGRNYQHIPEWQIRSARAGDDSQQANAARAVATLKSFRNEIMAKALTDSEIG